MDSRIESNKQFLADLFAGPFRGHAVLTSPEPVAVDPELGDFTLSTRSVRDWLPTFQANYEAALKHLESVGHDGVPYVGLNTNTGIFAAAFGCPLHRYDDSPAAARPIVKSPQEADRLALPDHRQAPTLARAFELGHLIEDTLGRDTPIGVPDIQSPFDIAALIWNKEDFFIALHESPDAVKRLVDKCHRLLKGFLLDFRRTFPQCNLCHCPRAWAPPELGCWLSEDEAGALSVAMFDEFCLPSLLDLSETFGGMFLHCCADADHQYDSFRRIPNLRGLNRVFRAPGPRPTIEKFSDTTVLMVAWTSEEDVLKLLNMALPQTRFLFDMGAHPLKEANALYERLRARCPRR